MPPIMTKPLLLETHSHTPLCKHARGEPGEYAHAALEGGLAGIIFTCHTPLPDGVSSNVRMSPDQWPAYIDLIAETAAEFDGRTEVRLGIEMDFIPGFEPWAEKILAEPRLEYVLGSVHPQIGFYRALYFREDWPAFFETYFRHLAEAAETGLFDTLAHPDLVKNENPEVWRDTAMESFILKCLDRIAATGTAMELNTSGMNKAIPEMNPGPSILRAMAERGIPVVIGADAHDPHRVGDRFPEALRLLAECGFEKVSLFRQRQREDHDLQEALNSLSTSVEPTPVSVA